MLKLETGLCRFDVAKHNYHQSTRFQIAAIAFG